LFKFFRKNREERKRAQGGFEYIVAGLGNPGRRFERTRHNAGFMTLDCLAQKLGAKLDWIRFKSYSGSAFIAGKKVLLLKPQTFMNLSGNAVREAAEFYKIPMERVIVVFDDISLPLGKIRVRPKGSDGGHNGVKNIIYLTGTDVFPRVKIGVGLKPFPEYDAVSWVTEPIPPEDFKVFAQSVERACEAVGKIISEGVEKAMSDYN
jgi:PTH1 family peptidyl-tRNA hydrolase